MSRSMVQMADAVKASLESFRDRERDCKTASDAVERLLELNEKAKRFEIKVREEAAEEKARRGREDLTIGSDRKEELLGVMKLMGLKSPNQALEFLLIHFNDSQQFEKSTLFWLGANR